MITSKSSYEYFNGRDGNGHPVWSNDINAKQPVFEDPNGVGWNLAVSYNAGLERYILTTEHTNSRQGNLGIFDAPEPWGPWTTVAYMNRSDGTHFAHDFSSVPETTFSWNFSNKWLSEDGKAFTIVFTGTGDNDSWNSVRGRFEAAVRGSTIPPIDTTSPIDVVSPTEPAPRTDTTPPRDTSLPTAPINLGSSKVSTTEIILTWTLASSPDGRVNSYKVYRDGVPVGTSSETTFTDTDLMEGVSYTYEVSAVNSNGVEGPKSAPITSSTFVAAGTNPVLISVVVIGVVFLIGLTVSCVVFLRRTAR
jgi:hypothetical protein